jgi:predicted Zn-dependent protease with MMP-like domain
MAPTPTAEFALPATLREAAEEVVVESEDAAHDVIMALDQAVTTFGRWRCLALTHRECGALHDHAC